MWHPQRYSWLSVSVFVSGWHLNLILQSHHYCHGVITMSSSWFQNIRITFIPSWWPSTQCHLLQLKAFQFCVHGQIIYMPFWMQYDYSFLVKRHTYKWLCFHNVLNFTSSLIIFWTNMDSNILVILNQGDIALVTFSRTCISQLLSWFVWYVFIWHHNFCQKQ